MNKLAQLVREIVDNYLDEEKKYTGAPRLGVKILDKEKAEKVKKLYAGHWVADMIQAIEDAGETGTSYGDLAQTLNKKYQYIIADLKALSDNGVISGARPEKAEKVPSTGQRGRPASDKTKVAKEVNAKLEADKEYQPTEDELATLGAEFIEKLRKRVKGELKRGRPAKKDDLDGLKAAMKEETLDEYFVRMKKLAGV